MSAVTNHQLFSHAFLTQLQNDPANDEAAAPIAQGLRDWLPSRDGSTLQSLMDSWVGPLLDFLDFYHAPADDAPDIHLLYAHRADETPVGLCYVVPPGQDGSTGSPRGLDDTLKGRHPLAQAVLALRARSLRWGMLTDGTRWRLVDAESLYRYEHYLEVNVDELARSNDPIPLRLFYACFHRHVFTPSPSQGEPALSKAEGGRGEGGFPSPSQGEGRREGGFPSPSQGEGRREGGFPSPSQGEGRVRVGLDQLLAASERATQAAEDHLKARVSHNEGILAQLCLGLVRADGRARYTEAERDAIYQDATTLLYRMLFILHAEARGLLPTDNPAYRTVSLSELVKTARAYKLRGMPDPQATTLWERLKRLCTAIYESDPALGIAAYNGGLFDDADKPYLQRGSVADMHLAEALFDLAYRPDNAAPDGYQPLDYRDLSVRHLGSLYEGMIEYKLQIAEETLWARRDGKGNVRFLRTGQEGAPRKTDAEITPGQVYFSQSPGERHATGTYYTPEYIVDYIVRQTVVRGLEERRGPLEAKLKETSEVSETSEVLDEELLRFVEEQVLTFRTCDPGMGSGHFLVNAAHQMANFIVETLHLTPWPAPPAAPAGPQSGDLHVDTDPLAWRRRVVERCLYGVDLSRMAVELAKLSLWLASVAEDRPLSFLDHHLRQGNSLVGARLADMAAVLAGPAPAPSKREEKQRAAGQLSMLDDPAFARHVTAATGLLAHISARVAETVEDVKAQAADYEQMRAELEPYRQLANLVVARHFGVDVDERQLRAVVRYLVNGAVGPAPEYQGFLNQAQDLAHDRCFFHWELEFPQVFLDPRNRARAKAGFDAVIGNPPYVRQERLSAQKRFFQAAFAEVYSGIADLYVFFIAQGIKNLVADGLLGFITANKWLRADYAAPLRAYLPAQAKPVQLLDFGHSDVFPGTDTFPSILIAAGLGSQGSEGLHFADVSDRARGATPLPEHVIRHGYTVPLLALRREGWLLEPPEVSDLLCRLQAGFPRLREWPGIDALFGIKTGFDAAFCVDTTTREQLIAADPACEPLVRKLLRGRNIRRWRPVWGGDWMITIPASANRDWPWSSSPDERAAEEKFQANYPALHAHLKPFEAKLRRRQDHGRFWWELRPCDYYDMMERPKIVVQQILYHPVFALDTDNHLANAKVYSLTTDGLYLLGLLNSRVMWWYLYRVWPHMKDEALAVQKFGLLTLPIPDAPADLRARIETLVRQAIALSGEPSPDLLAVEQHLNRCMVEAYGLSRAEVAIIEQTLPPRDPLVVLENRLRKAERAPTT